MRMLYCCVALVLVCSCASVPSQAQNLVANPGFETGQPIYNPGTPAQGSQNNMWFTNEAMPDSRMTWSVTGAAAHSGSYSAVAVAGPTAATDRNAIGLRQTYIPLLPNSTYTLSFYYKTEGAGWIGSNDACIMDPQVHELTAGGGLILWYTTGVLTQAAADWTFQSAQFVTGATTEMGRLKFNLNLVNEGQDKLFLDDVSVTLVPEPGTLISLLAGLASAGALRRRRA